MVIFLNAQGDAEIVTPEKVYQGSNDVTEITVVAPLAATTAMNIGFILPNGLYWQAPPVNAEDGQSGGNYAPMTLIKQDMTTRANVWQYTLPRSVTERHGMVQIAINAVSDITYETAGGQATIKKNCTSYLCEFTVEESVVPDLPTEPEPDVYSVLRQYLTLLEGRTVNVPNLVASIQKESGNSFSYTDNSGVKSEPIAFGMVDYDPTYIGAASVVEIPSLAWERKDGGNYQVDISATQHGQMKDGVEASDLMLSFRLYDQGADRFVPYNATFAIDEEGNITLSASTVPNGQALFMSVWNGKGLADMTARNEIAAEVKRAESAEATLQSNIIAETQRAESAENNLQAQIDHIEQSGVDLTARADIAAETAARESADAELQSDINAEQTRAEAAEQGLQNAVNTNASGIQELRDDVTKIESYIPSSTTAENQLADKAFVNSSINDIAAFYIESNARGDAFPTRAALLGATTFYHAGQTRVPTQNDYAIVLADESQPQGVDGKYPTTRYSYQTNEPGGTYPNGQWGFKYVVNNTSLTQAQVNAINSGITQSLVEQITENETAIASETSARTSADANLQQQIDALSAGAVYSVNGQTGTVTITAASIGAVPDTRTVNGHALSSNVTVTKSDVGLGNVANERQYSANNPPPLYRHSVIITPTITGGATATLSLPPIYTTSNIAINTEQNLRNYFDLIGANTKTTATPCTGYTTGSSLLIRAVYIVSGGHMTLIYNNSIQDCTAFTCTDTVSAA